MFDLRFYFVPEKPVDYGEVNVKLEGDFYEDISDEDKKKIDKKWKEIKEELGSKVYSSPGSLGVLWGAKNKDFVYKGADFKLNAVVAKTYEKRIVSDFIYRKTLVPVVGCALKLKSGEFIIQKRSKEMWFVPNVLDSSVAGYVNPTSSGLDFQEALYEKLERELGVNRAEVKDLRLTNVHSSRGDHSAAFSFVASCDLTREDILKGLNEKYVSDVEFVHEKDVKEFIIERYGKKGDLIGEGAAVLLTTLKNSDFLEAVSVLKKLGKSIEFGSVISGDFVITEMVK